MSLKRNYLLALELVTFSHTLFILPLILSGYFIVYKKILLLDIFLIILAAISARTIGMLFNRIIDNEIDFKNPRTSSRPIPSGRASKNFVFLLLFFSISIYLLSCWLICDFVFIENLPDFNEDNSNQQQRFITLIDIIYEKKIPLMITSHVNLESINSSKSIKKPFKRTISRLYELN